VRQINISDARPGMVLAQDVLNMTGMVLLRKGAILTERHVKMLRTWGVTAIAVEGGAETPSQPTTQQVTPSEAIEKLKQVIEQRLQLVFSRAIDDPLMKALHQAALEQLLEEVSTGQLELSSRW
jgi:hypothetical protein